MGDDLCSAPSGAKIAAPFSYLFIPCEDTRSVEEHRFEGTSDEALRQQITRHFQREQLTTGQVKEYQDTLRAKFSDGNREAMNGMLAQVAESSSFEVVPVTMPTTANGFIATSLYIDDAGAFKELPVNSRASRLVQKPIRGDAFLLSNHDDPVADDWERVDTTMAQYDALQRNPGQAVNLDDKRQLALHNAARENSTVVITKEALEKASSLKEAGNAAVTLQNWDEAASAYSAALDHLSGRLDQLPDSKAAEALKVACLSNRSYCHMKRSRWQAMTDDATRAVQMDPRHAKAWFRKAVGHMQLREFGGDFESAVQQCRMVGVPESEVAALEASAGVLLAEAKATDRQRFGKMFK